MHHSQQRVIEPLPREPGLALHSGRKRVHPRDGVRSQNLLTRTDVPSNISIGVRTIGEWPNEQRPQRNQEDQVANRGKKKARPTLVGCGARSGSIRSPLICGNHEACCRLRPSSAAVHLDVREASGYWKRGRAARISDQNQPSQGTCRLSYCTTWLTTEDVLFAEKASPRY